MEKKLLTLILFLLTISSFSVEKEKPEIMVHTAAHKLALKNTIAATNKCIEMGADYVEIDVKTSKNRVFNILHDFYSIPNY